MVKRCAWGTCNTDSRYPKRLIKDGIPVTFHPFPSERKFKKRRESWIRACCRADGFVCTKDSYVCIVHILLERKGQQKNILIPFQRQQVEIRSCGLAEREKHQLYDLPMEKRFRTANDRLAAESMLLLSSAKSDAVDALLSLCDARLDRDICKNSDASSSLCDARLQDPSCEESLTDEGQD
ncbi:zinc finger 554-like isoform X1 [Paramuricea clavata]|uniref:Zinc finger 554-like isoform X1 n=1 Tax=Paramuricea clavata TaxID=317549 RepID=A0A6S7JXD0_PARCT|nr:zinc finger 554-like isoform X1 [Paramuricea clavata]